MFELQPGVVPTSIQGVLLAQKQAAVLCQLLVSAVVLPDWTEATFSPSRLEIALYF